MTNPIVKLINVETGEEVEREMDANELSQWQLDSAKFLEQQADKAAAQAAKAELLARLGITAEEAALLLA